MFGSLTTISNMMVSRMSGFPSGLRYRFSTSNSSITPPSRAQRLLLPMCEVAPRIHRRTSLDALPPRTGRSCTSTTLLPARAAVMAAQTPARPPPITATSHSNWSVFSSRELPGKDLIINCLLCWPTHRPMFVHLGLWLLAKSDLVIFRLCRQFAASSTAFVLPNCKTILYIHRFHSFARVLSLHQ